MKSRVKAVSRDRALFPEKFADISAWGKGNVWMCIITGAFISEAMFVDAPHLGHVQRHIELHLSDADGSTHERVAKHVVGARNCGIRSYQPRRRPARRSIFCYACLDRSREWVSSTGPPNLVRTAPERMARSRTRSIVISRTVFLRGRSAKTKSSPPGISARHMRAQPVFIEIQTEAMSLGNGEHAVANHRFRTLRRKSSIAGITTAASRWPADGSISLPAMLACLPSACRRSSVLTRGPAAW